MLKISWHAGYPRCTGGRNGGGAGGRPCWGRTFRQPGLYRVYALPQGRRDRKTV